MLPNLPRLHLSPRPPAWDVQAADLSSWGWADVPPLPPFLLADGSGLAQQQTRARVCFDQHALYVRFDCDDKDIWGHYTQRDEPLYDEEVVEVFLSPGSADPIDYFEFEVSPNGVLLDVKAHNPTSQRADLELDFGWDCPGLRWQAGRNDVADHWWAVLVIPWAAVALPGPLPSEWRANFYRIERPHQVEPEFSCWSPTLTDPADFHKPAYFGVLVLDPHLPGRLKR